MLRGAPCVVSLCLLRICVCVLLKRSEAVQRVERMRRRDAALRVRREEQPLHGLRRGQGMCPRDKLLVPRALGQDEWDRCVGREHKRRIKACGHKHAVNKRIEHRAVRRAVEFCTVHCLLEHRAERVPRHVGGREVRLVPCGVPRPRVDQVQRREVVDVVELVRLCPANRDVLHTLDHNGVHVRREAVKPHALLRPWRRGAGTQAAPP